MPRKKKAHDYFVYKSNPFRPLYMGGHDFRTPPPPKSDIHLWLFRIRNTARLMASANKAEYAPIEDYHNLARGRIPSLKPRLEDLA